MNYSTNAFVDSGFVLGRLSPAVGGLVLVAFLAIVGRTIGIFGSSAESFPLAGYSSQHWFPTLRAQLGWFLNGAKYIDDAFAKYPDKIFKVPSLNRLSLVLPPKFLSEVKDAPDNVLSNAWATTDFFMGNWTTMDYSIVDHPSLEAIKTQFISKLGLQIESAADEADYALGNIFPNYEEWTPILLHAKIRPLMVQTTTRTIVGQHLCRNPVWIESCMGFGQSVALTSTYIKILPPFLRPLAYLIPDYYRIHQNKRKLHQVLEPQIKQFLLDRKYGNDWGIQGEAKTLIGYYAGLLPEHEMTPSKLAHRLIGSSFGAFQLTTGQLTNCILDLTARFHIYAPALRREIEEVLGEEQNITNAHLARMWKLDSFMKESLRFHPPSKLSCNRKVMKPYRLSSGTVLPVGAHISFPGGSMSLSNTYINDAKTFDGFRFERMRLDPTQNQNGLQFTSASEAAMHMGGGRQQCPGRFFGSAINKIVLIKLLQKFDFKLKGEKRPENLRLMDMDIAHPEAEIMVRDRAY